MDLTLACMTLLHVLIFVYWLGGDLGVFYLSGTVIDADASVSDRQLAVKLLLNLDMVPRVALIMTLPTGFTLASVTGWLPLPSAMLIVLWLVALAWLWLVFKLHAGASTLWRKIDLWLRIGVLSALLAFVALGTAPLFLKLKLSLLALTIVLGLIIRRVLGPLGPGLTALASGDLPSANHHIRNSIGRSRMPVLGIWMVLLLAALIGIWKPA